MLEDGTTCVGIGFGYPAEVVGEVVFNTGMVGYTEALTDPSYFGQILCLTYPLIGNYGVPSIEIEDEYGLPKYFESDSIQIKGLVVHDLSTVASHWSSIKTLDEWLNEERIPGIFGVDTREITKKIRINGVMMGRLSVSKGLIQDRTMPDIIDSVDYGRQNFLGKVSVNRPMVYGQKNQKCVVLLDTGTKYSIIRNIRRLGYRVIRLPWDSSYETIMSYKPEGVVISNGPGDPKVCKIPIQTASKLLEMSIPTLGICLGNQILALAGGGDTFKLKFGHRGQNKACVDLQDRHGYITSQNHGYGIEPGSLSGTDFRVWFVNGDDDSIEGIEHKSKPIIAVQFHPEASPGPHDCMFVFDRFRGLIEENENSLGLKRSRPSKANISRREEEKCQRTKL
jgi:carbamoyl-phosphate synthase small subunit